MSNELLVMRERAEKVAMETLQAIKLLIEKIVNLIMFDNLIY